MNEEEKRAKKNEYMKRYYRENKEYREYRKKYNHKYQTDPEFKQRRKKQYAADSEKSKKNVARAQKHYFANHEKKKKYAVQRQYKAKKKAVSILGSKCMRCGYDEHPAALQFHHRDPSTKEFNITSKQLTNPGRYTWDILEAEIMKCDLLCANCHSVIECTWDISDWKEETEDAN